MRRKNIIYMLWAVTLCLFCGCKGDNPLQPKSGGRPYEVLLVDDDQGVVRSQLTVDMVGLPQPEPWFDVVLTDSAGYQSNGKTMRNVVKVDVSPGAVERTVLRYERNVFAAPQIIVHVVTPSWQALHNEMPQLGGRLRTLLNNAERSREMAFLSSHHAMEPTAEVERLFGAQMWIPVEMKASMKADNFLWFSNDAAEGMCNLCVYRIPSADTARFVAARDSMMEKNIKGETDVMNMTTAHIPVRWQRQSDDSTWVARGLWEMKGDAMGGPFVARVMPQNDGSAIVAEAFVYAPEGKKRNFLRRTEASIFTFKKVKE